MLKKSILSKTKKELVLICLSICFFLQIIAIRALMINALMHYLEQYIQMCFLAYLIIPVELGVELTTIVHVVVSWQMFSFASDL